MRRARGAPSRFPTLPGQGDAEERIEFAKLRQEFTVLRHTKAKRAREGQNTDDVELELARMLTTARAIVDRHCTRSSQRLVQPRFHSVLRTHPKFARLAPLRQAHRRIRNSIRDGLSSRREDLEAEAAEVLLQATTLLEDDAGGDCPDTPLTAQASDGSCAEPATVA